MKHISTFLLFLCVILAGAFKSSAQTNTFPASGNVGIGTTAPTNRLDVRGNVTIDNGTTGAGIYTGTGTSELKRYLSIFNSTGKTSASGLKAGGILVADLYDYANPGKNDLVVKGDIGIGVPKPTNKLDVRGHITIEAGRNPTIFTGIGTQELNRYLTLINSTGKASASGLKAGGVLVADLYDYADPGKNDLVVKGDIGIGVPKPTNKLDVRGHITIEAGRNPTIFTGVGTEELNRYLTLINSTALGSASGLKAGGVLVADAYAYANPGKNDLIVKGSISVGTTSSRGYKLAVNGTIRAKEIKVEAANWPDYVFEENYHMQPLADIEAFIRENRHLPGIPDKRKAEEEGIDLGEMNRKLLEKVEELTLHLIEKDRAIAAQRELLGEVVERLGRLEGAKNMVEYQNAR